MAVAGSEGAAIHPAAAVRKGEPIVVTHHISPFVGTDLETLLRASGINTLVLAGVRTSGVVLSAVRHAGDLDYRMVVVRDCCADPGPRQLYVTWFEFDRGDFGIRRTR